MLRLLKDVLGCLIRLVPGLRGRLGCLWSRSLLVPTVAWRRRLAFSQLASARVILW